MGLLWPVTKQCTPTLRLVLVVMDILTGRGSMFVKGEAISCDVEFILICSVFSVELFPFGGLCPCRQHKGAHAVQLFLSPLTVWSETCTPAAGCRWVCTVGLWQDSCGSSCSSCPSCSADVLFWPCLGFLSHGSSHGKHRVSYWGAVYNTVATKLVLQLPVWNENCIQHQHISFCKHKNPSSLFF